MLDMDQKAAVEAPPGPMLVLAGPGAGKTFVLVERIRYMLRFFHIPPEEILVLTFTRAAAKEMRERFTGACGPAGEGVVFGTFHSVFLEILKRSGALGGRRIMDRQMHGFLLKRAAEISKLSGRDEPGMLRALARETGFVKNAGIPPEEHRPRDLSKEEFVRFFHTYEEQRRLYEQIDFDDILRMAYRMFADSPAQLSRWQGRFQHLLIDEAQDMNRIQFETVRLLAAPRKSIYAVGDDDQSIYAFRAADPKLMLSFQKVYPDAAVCRLGTNYRSLGGIVDASLSLIGRNTDRFEKRFRAARGEGGIIDYRRFSDAGEEASYLSQALAAERAAHPDRSIAVLYRNHEQSIPLQKALSAGALGYRSRDRFLNPYAHFIAEDVGCYLSLAVRGWSRAKLLRILNRPDRRLPRQGIERDPVDVGEWKRFFGEEDPLFGRITQLEGQIGRLGRMSPYAALHFIRRGIGYDRFLTAEAARRGESAEDYGFVWEALFTLAEDVPNTESFLAALTKERVSFDAQKGGGADDVPDVVLSTFHGSKGLEFDHVYLIEADEGITPSLGAMDEDRAQRLEEERRLFYVAVTRARDHLTITGVRRRGNTDVVPSRFIRELAGEEKEEKTAKKGAIFRKLG